MKGKQVAIKMSDDQLRALLKRITRTAKKGGQLALNKLAATHKSGGCNCSDIRREIANTMLPEIQRVNSGESAELLAMMIAQSITEKAVAQLNHNRMLREVASLLGSLGRNQSPRVEGDEWKNEGE